jgi:hypothetical protein
MTPSASSGICLLAAVAVVGLAAAPRFALAQGAPPPPPASAPAAAPASAPTSAPAAPAAPAPAAPAPAAPAPSPPAAAPSGGSAWAIPAAAAPSVYALFPAPRAPLPPTELIGDGVDIRQAQVEGCFKGPAGRQCVTLVHPSQARAGDRRTRFFAVRAAPGTDPAVLAAAVDSITKGEHDSPWLSVSPGRTAGQAKPRRSPAIVIGVVLLLVALWLAARAAQRRTPPSGPAASGEPPAKPEA